MSFQNLFASQFEEYDEEKIIYDQQPIRLFKSDVLEWFTHVSPVVVLVLFMPVVFGAVLYGAWNWAGMHWLVLPAMFLVGLGVWTLTEYLVHRFFFHLEPQTVWGKRLIFLFHGVHHVQPHVKTRLVMPPAVSIPGALLFGAVFLAAFRVLGVEALMWPTFGGFTLGFFFSFSYGFSPCFFFSFFIGIFFSFFIDIFVGIFFGIFIGIFINIFISFFFIC